MTKFRIYHFNLSAYAGVFGVAIIMSAALFAPLISPYDPNAQLDLLSRRNLPPSWEHPMGTDKFSRDVCSRVIFGARASLVVALSVAVVASLLGSVYGFIAGWLAAKWDQLLMRAVDLVMAIPALFLIMAFTAFFQPSFLLLMIVLAATGWMGTARLTRGLVASLREREFVLAARGLGLSTFHIFRHHLLPHALPVLLPNFMLKLALVILVESALSFLGIGVQPPAPSWGSIIADGRQQLLESWWVAAFPGLAIIFTVISFNLCAGRLAEKFAGNRNIP